MHLLPFIMLLFLVSCISKSSKEVMQKYGIGFNAERKKAGLHLVSEDMKVREHDEGKLYAFVHMKFENATKPSFLWKSVLIDSGAGKITHESDIYYNPREDLEIDYEYEYDDGETYIFLAKSSDPHSREKRTVDFPRADSILKAWGIQPPERLK